MKRVAALWLPTWSIDRIVRAEPTLAPPERVTSTFDASDVGELIAAAQAEQVLQCDAPRNTGWRPGARWARNDVGAPKGGSRRDVEMQIAALPQHQRPPMRMLGRASEAIDHPFRRLPSDDGASGMSLRRGSNDPHAAPPDVSAFLDTGRSMVGRVDRVCHEPGIGRASDAIVGVILITIHKVGARVEVAAASPAAQALGIGPGMALTQVRASVPQVIVRNADPEGDAAMLHDMAIRFARRWTPTVSVSDPDGLLLDLSGVAHLHGGEARTAVRLVRLLGRMGISARIAIADTAGAAWGMARYGARPIAICPPGAQAELLGPLPAAALRLPEATLALLRRLGVETAADVFGLPRGPFARRFGIMAARRLDQALGRAPEPLEPVVPVEAVEVEQRFAEPIGSAEVIDHWLGVLVPALTQAMAKVGQGARVLLLVADRVDGRPQSLRIGFARPNRDPTHILRLIRRRIEDIDPGFGIDALRLVVRRAEPLAPQPFDETLTDKAPDLSVLIDMLANRAVPTWRAQPMESDVPERSVTCSSPLDAPVVARSRLKIEDVLQLDTSSTRHPWHPRWPRPARLLHRPERLDHVISELPDRPPVRFTWRGRPHVVVRADGPERIAGEWWRRSAEREAIRDYFQVEDEAGQRFWVFRRGDGERAATGNHDWYMHGRFG